MEEIKAMCPSWKGDVRLARVCYGAWRSWEAECCDVWGHMHTPLFCGSSARQVLEGVKQFVQRMVSNDGCSDYVNDDGVACGDCTSMVYLNQDPGG